VTSSNANNAASNPPSSPPRVLPVGDRTQYLNLGQIDAVCGAVTGRVLVGGGALVPALRRELTALSANGLRSSALGQGLFGPHAPRPGVIAIAGPGGVGKTYFAELLARILYGEHFGDHLLAVNCRAYFAGRFPPLPRAKLEGGPLAIVALDGAEVLPEIPPVAALWADAIRFGRAALPAADEHGRRVVADLNIGSPSAEPLGASTEHGGHVAIRASEGAASVRVQSEVEVTHKATRALRREQRHGVGFDRSHVLYRPPPPRTWQGGVAPWLRLRRMRHITSSPSTVICPVRHRCHPERSEGSL